MKARTLFFALMVAMPVALWSNIDMWQVLMTQPGKVAKEGRDKMRASLEVIKTNLAKVRVAAEKERWEANRELWTVTLRLM